MPQDANLSVSMSTKTARQEIKLLNAELKSSKLDFKALASEMKDTSNQNAVLNAQVKNLSGQLSTQQKITERTKQAVNDAGKALESSKKRMEEFKSRLDAAENSEERNQKEIDRLKNSVVNAESAVKRNEAGLRTWENKLKSSENAENELRSAIQKTNEELTLHSSVFQRANDKIDAFKNKYNEGVQSVANISGGLQTAGRNLTYGLTAPIVGLGAAAVNAAVDFEDAFTGVEKTVNATPEQLETLKGEIRDMAKEIPQTAGEIAGIAEAAGQLGIQTDNIALFTRTMADLGVATNLTGEEAASTLAKFANITGMSQGDFDRLGATIVALGNNLATTEADITNMGIRIAAAGKQVNMSESDILAWAGALSSVGLEAEAGGSAFSKFVLEMQMAAQSGGKSLQQFSEVAGMSADEFTALFNKDANAAITAFLSGLNQMENKAAVLDEMGMSEIRLRDTLLRSSEAIDIVNQSLALGESAWAENTALADEASRKYANTASQLQILKNNLTDIGITLGETFLPWLVKASEKVQEFADWFAQLDEEGQKNVLTWAAVAAAAGPVLSLLGKGISVVNGLRTAFSLFSTGAAAAGTAVSGAAASTGLFSGALTALTGPVGISIAVVGALAAAVGGCVWAYNKAQEEARTYGKYLTESTEAMNDQIAAATELKDVLAEREKLELTVESDTASIEEVTEAQNKLKDSTQWLIDNYGSYLSSESLSTGVITDTDLERLNEALEIKKEIAIENQKATINENQGRFENSLEELPRLQSERDATLEQQLSMEKQLAVMQRYNNEWKKISESTDYLAADEVKKAEILQGKLDELNQELSELGFNGKIEGFGLLEAGAIPEQIDDIEKAKEAIENYDTQIEQHNDSITQMKNATRAVMDVMMNELPEAMEKGGDAVTDSLSQIGTYGKDARLTFEEMGNYAEDAALKLNGFGSMAEAAAAGEEAVDAVLRDTVKTMQSFGYTAEQGAVQAALLAGGFNSIEDAAQQGGLQKVADQATEVARRLGLIPEDTVIQVNAEGNSLEVLDKAASKAKNLDGTEVRIKYTEFVGPIKPANIPGNAKGTSYSPGGESVVNEKGRELIEHRDGSFSYVDSDGPALTYLEPGDKVYTHEQSKQMARNRRVTLPGFATGKDNKTAFEREKENFQHQKNTSNMSVQEELNWWKNIQTAISLTEEEAREVSEEIFQLTQDLSEELVKKSNEYIKAREEDSESWIEKEKKYNHMSAAEEAEAYDRMIAYHKEELNKMLADERVTQEQKDQLWAEYTKKFEQYEEKKYDVAQQYIEGQLEKLQELRDWYNEDSENWIEERDFYGDWGEYGDNKLAALMRVRERNEKDLTVSLREVDDMYWLSEEEKEEERQKRWDEGNQRLLELDRELYTERKKILDEYVEDYIESKKQEIEAARDSEQEKLNAELEAIEKRYEALDEADEQEDRDEQRREYEETARKYRNSATREGQSKYKEAIEALEELDEEEERLAREKRKEEEIAQKNEEIKASEEKYEAMLEDAEEYGEKLAAGTAKWARLNREQLQTAGAQTGEAVAEIYAEYYREQTEYLQNSLTAFDAMIQEIQRRADTVVTLPDGTAAQNAGTQPVVKQFEVAYNNYGEQHYGDGIDVETFFDDMAYNVLRPKLV